MNLFGLLDTAQVQFILFYSIRAINILYDSLIDRQLNRSRKTFINIHTNLRCTLIVQRCIKTNIYSDIQAMNNACTKVFVFVCVLICVCVFSA